MKTYHFHFSIITKFKSRRIFGVKSHITCTDSRIRRISVFFNKPKRISYSSRITGLPGLRLFMLAGILALLWLETFPFQLRNSGF